MKILLNYFFPITAIVPTPAASTAFLNQVLLVCKPGGDDLGTDGVIYELTAASEASQYTANEEVEQLFSAGLNKVYLMVSEHLDLADYLEGHESEFHTILISSDFNKDDVILAKALGGITITNYANLVSGTDDTIQVGSTTFTAQAGAATLGTATFQAATSIAATTTSLVAQINAHAVASTEVVATDVGGGEIVITAKKYGELGNSIALLYADNDTNVGATVTGATLAGGAGLTTGEFTGVVGVSSDDEAFLSDQAAIENRCAFYAITDNGAQNMLYAFGKLLSNSLNWKNQQYITMPLADDVSTVGAAESFFDDKVSFVISDDEFGERLALFVCGGKAIVEPYIKKNLQIDMQSAALSYISGNQPAYTKVQAALLESELQKVIDLYIADESIESGTVEILLENSNFVATSNINIAEPKALWRIEGEMRQTL